MTKFNTANITNGYFIVQVEVNKVSEVHEENKENFMVSGGGRSMSQELEFSGGLKYFLKKIASQTEEQVREVRDPIISPRSRSRSPSGVEYNNYDGFSYQDFESNGGITNIYDTNQLLSEDPEKIIDMQDDNDSFCSTPMTTNYGSMSNLSILSRLELKNKTTDRAIQRDGSCNFKPINIESQKIKYLNDLFTTLIEMNWFYTICIFVLCYFASWLTFALAWYLNVRIHGDFEHIGNDTWKPCVAGIDNFKTAFLFSVETQHTTGYGWYHLTDNCYVSMLIFCSQSIFGVILEGILVGLILVKVSQAKKRVKTLIFSKNAIISLRDGHLCLIVRIADMRTSCQLLDAKIRAQFISKKVTAEGEIIPYFQQELEVTGEGENGLLLFWPTFIVHKIDQNSPLYHLSACDFGHEFSNFEIIFVLEGVVESTGLTTQAKCSYIPSEIKWGERFKNLNRFSTSKGERVIDFSRFHDTYKVKTPEKSSADLEKLSHLLNKIKG